MRSPSYAGCANSEWACVANKATPPFELIAVNSAWTDLCGYPASEALGRSPKELLHGAATDAKKSKEFTARLEKASGLPCHVTLINYTKRGNPFAHVITSELVRDSKTGEAFYITESCAEQDVQVVGALFRKAHLADPVWSGEAGVLLALVCSSVLIASLFAASFLAFTPPPVEDAWSQRMLSSFVEPAFSWASGVPFAF